MLVFRDILVSSGIHSVAADKLAMYSFAVTGFQALTKKAPDYSDDSWLVKIAKSIDGDASTILIVLGTILASFSGMVQNDQGLGWLLLDVQGRWFFFSSILIIIGTFIGRQERISVQRLKKTVKQHEKDLSIYRQVYTNTIPDEIKVLYNSLQFNNSERISIFQYSEGQDLYQLLDRYSINNIHKRTGSKVYPGSHGVLGKLLSEDCFFVDRLPDPEKDELNYYSEIRRKIGMLEHVARQRTMQARSYAGFALYDFEGFAGAIVFESQEPNGLDFEKLKLVMREGESDRLKNLLERTRDNLDPSLRFAAGEEL